MRLFHKFLTIYRRFILEKTVKDYIDLNRQRFRKKTDKSSSPIILVDFLDSYPIHETYAYVANVTAQKYKAQIKYFKFEYDRYDLLFINRKVRHIYNSFNAYKGFSYKVSNLVIASRQAFKIFKSLKSKEDIVSLVIEGIPVGDLVYDTFLRKYNKTTVELKSKKLFFMLFLTFLIFYSIKDYFSKNNIKAVFPGDVAYIFSGIIAKYAIKEGVKVYSIIEANGFLITEIDDNSNFYRRMPYWKYTEVFNTFTVGNQNKFIKQACEILENRLHGKLDTTLAYMGNSAFSDNIEKKRILSNNESLKILIPLHDFFDSPHIYRSMLFVDFWNWITFTMDNATQTDFEWYVKPHPNALPQNNAIIKELKLKYKDYKNIKFIDANISNKQLLEEGIDVVFTVYGSIAHEFAYKNKVVVNAGDNPHIGYDFNIHAKDIHEYKYFVHNADKLSLNINKDDIGRFFYMHYLHYQPFKLLNPVYPPCDYIEKYKLHNITSKNKRIMYHKSTETLKYYLDGYSVLKHKKILDYLKKVL